MTKKQMIKKYVPVKCRERIYKLFQDDLKRINYMGKAVLPPLPKFISEIPE